mgnify:FL=1
MKYLPVVILSIAGWLFMSAAFAGLLSPVAQVLKRSRSEERKVSLSVEDQTPDDLTALAAAFDVDPRPTYGYERLYNASDLVQVGLAMVHRRCADARRDAATDHICDPCGRIFGKALSS